MTSAARRKTLIADLKKVPSDGSGVWTGLASTFDEEPDRQGDIIVRGAFADSIAGWRKRRDFPPVFWMHRHEDPDSLVGRLTSMQEIDRGLLVSGKLNLKGGTALSCYERMLDGSLSAMSIGYDVLREHRRADGVNVLERVDLLEVSLASVPANPNARILATKSATPVRQTCRAGHPLDEPRVLALGTHPASVCIIDGSVNVWAPNEVSDAAVKTEIGRIRTVIAARSKREIDRLNATLDSLETDTAHRRSTLHPDDEITHYRNILNVLAVSHG